MKGRIFVVVVLVAAAAFAGRWVNRAVHVNAGATRREETRQTFRLDAGARVEVGFINGLVEVKTADTDTAEVRIVRTASSPEDLEYKRVTVAASPSSLVVHGERNDVPSLWHRLWNGGGDVRQEVTLVLPRRVEVAAEHVNGNVNVGEVEGGVEIEHVNGRVEVAQTSGRAQVSHVNGGVKLGVAQLGEEGMEVEHVNGNIEVRFAGLVNADVEAEHHNGALALNVPNVTMQERVNRSYAHARFGTGGSPVRVDHVNGNVRFESDAGATTATTNTVSTIISTGALPPPPPPAPPAPPEPPVR